MLLCHQLKQSPTEGFISAVKDREGNVITDQRDIDVQFESLYENLYSSEAKEAGFVKSHD